MPKLTSEVKHDLGEKVAIRRLKDSCEWAHGISDLKETWLSNVMEFSVSIQGVRITGEIEVTENALKFVGRAPLIALPFKSWIHNILNNALKPRKSAATANHDQPHEPLVLYLHIPKAGGTTLGEFIYSQCKNEDAADEGLIRNGVFFTPDGFFRESESMTAAQLKSILLRNDLRAVMGHFAFGLHNFIERPYHYITTLREPVSRVISLYHYLELEGKMSLEDFGNACPYREIDNDQTRRIAGVNPDIGKCSESDLEMAKENLRKDFAVVGTTERFDETLVLLKQKLNWKRDVASYPKNVNTKKTQQASAAAINAIRKHNLLDTELYDYANRLMDETIAAQGESFSALLDQQKNLNRS